MTGFTVGQCLYLLKLLEEKHGWGYSKDVVKVKGGGNNEYEVNVGALQAGLGMNMEVARRLGRL